MGRVHAKRRVLRVRVGAGRWRVASCKLLCVAGRMPTPMLGLENGEWSYPPKYSEPAEQEVLEVDAHPMDNPVFDHYNNHYIHSEEKIKSHMKVIYNHQVYWCTEKKYIVQQLEYEERNMKRLERKMYESKLKHDNLLKELRAMNWHLDELDRDQREQQQDMESLNRNRKRSRD